MKSDRPLSICLVSNSGWSIFNYRHGLLQTLAASGARVSVIAPADASFAALESLGCQCIDLPLSSKGRRAGEDLRTLLYLRRCYRRIAPDIVFHYTIKPNIYGTLAAALAGVKSVAVTTGLGYVFLHTNLTARIAQWLYRIAFRFPAQVWFLNPDDRQAFVERGLLRHPERARLLLGEGIDLQRFAFRERTADKKNFDFILVGRLLWDKGVGEYIGAARLLKPRYPEARWRLLGPVGVANPSAISREQVEAWCREGLVEYLGEASDVRDAIAASDCVVLPSYREGVPRTLLEAAAMGRAIIATRVPGCIEVVTDRETGLLCEARDVADLARAMSEVLEMDRQAYSAQVLRARAKAEAQFDERGVIARYRETLLALTGKDILCGRSEE